MIGYVGDKNNIYALYGYSEYVEGDGLFRLVKMDSPFGLTTHDSFGS